MSGDILKEIDVGLRRIVALQLWSLQAIKVNLNEPFQLVNGNYSPIYVNCRQLISSAAFLDLFAAATRLLCEAEGISFDVIAGGETAGIPFSAFLARAFNRPMVYVRKQPKGHGIASAVEGMLPQGASVLLVEDLITDAGSKLGFVGSLKKQGATVKDILVIFDRLQGGREALEKESIRLHAITDMAMTLAVARDSGVLADEVFQAVVAYLRSPKKWHAERNLQFLE